MKKNKFVYKCELCDQKYTTKYIYDRHLLMCRFSLNSNKETDAEIEEGFDCYNTEDFQAGRLAFEKKSVPEFFGR